MRGRTPITRQATLNGKHFRSTWLVFNFSVVSPHPSRAAPGPPSPQGKASSRRGSLTFPWGKVPPQRRKRGGTGLILGPAPHPSGLRPATLSQERVFPPSRPGLRPVHLPRRERLPPAGACPYLPLGEGAAAAAEEGRYWVGSGSRPTPVRASPCHPLLGEGFSPHPSRLTACHLPRRGRRPPGGGVSLPSLWLFKHFFRLPPLRIP